MHALAFRKALAALDASNLPAFYARSCKGLWLADSVTLVLVGVAFAAIAARPALAASPIVVLLALVPAGTAVLIYIFVGSFFAAHLLLFASALALVASFVSR